MRKILVTGAKGQLGTDLMAELASRDVEALGVDIGDMDITDAEACRKVIGEYAPDVVIHCAAWTAVDAAEDEENKPKVRMINATGTENVARAAAEAGAAMMYFSTDYIFNGEGTRPWEPEDAAEPIGFYGLTKYEGELAIRKLLPEKFYILRIQWVYGLYGKNFIKTMLNLAKTRDTVTVVNDQIGSPSYTVDLAKAAADIALTDKYGTYHVANEGYVSWCDFAKTIFEKKGIAMNVVPVTTDEYPTKARRPHNSRMDTSSLSDRGFEKLPQWEDALDRFLTALDQMEE